MTRRAAPTRAGFTLVEVLVVMAIIAILVGILFVALGPSLGVGTRGDTSSRMQAIENAVGTFKSERSVPYIPAGTVDVNPASATFQRVTGPFRLRNSYTSTTNPNDQSFEAQYITRVFGRVNLADLGGGANFTGDLDANQTLLFFLNGIQEVDARGDIAFRGFRKGQQPFAAYQSGENRLGPYLDINKKHVETTAAFARLVDGWGVPFAYFVAYNGKPAAVTNPLSNSAYFGWNPAPIWNGLNGPYFTNTSYVNPNGFQLISAGPDKRFSPGGNWSTYQLGSSDDRANFATDAIGAGPQ